MKIIPQRDWIYLKIKKITKVGSIEIPDAVLEEEEIMEVIAVGPLVKKIKLKDRVIFLPQEAVKYTTLGKDEMNAFIREEDVIAVVK